MNSEDKFIIGIDLGNNSSTISYFDFNKEDIDVVDISGGYGKISVPTIVSYNMDTKDWVFGEYAILNRGFSNELIVENIVENLGKNITYEIDGKTVSLSFILAKFIGFLLENIKNINPNAKIEGIVLCVSCCVNEDITKDIKDAFKELNIEHLLLKIANDKECILKSYFYENDINGDKILLIDYSSRQVRANIYQIHSDGAIKCLKASSSENIAEKVLFDNTKELILKKFIEETGKLDLTEYEKINLDTFTYQQFDIIFQRQIVSDIKLYYNFFYPPFQKTITKTELFNIILKFENEINIFLNELFENLPFKESEIKNIVLSGGGIEIDFIHKYMKSRFNIEKNFKGKAKRLLSDGACIIATQELGVLPKDKMHVEDLERLSFDIGVFIKDKQEDKFEILANKNSFIWQKFDKKVFLIDSKIIDFDLVYEKDINDYTILKNIHIDLGMYNQFFERDIKTIRLLVWIEFKSPKELVLVLEDFGFGEIYPKTDFKQEIFINL